MVPKYPVLELKPAEFQAWADEGYEFALKDVYPGFGVNEAVSEQY